MTEGIDASDISNFRDASSPRSGSMRPGLVYRSAELSGVSELQQQALVGLGISDVFDLRTSAEVEHRPDHLPESITIHVLDVLADRPHSGAAAVASLVTDKQDETTIDDVNDAVQYGRGHDLMIQTYRHLVSLPSAHARYRDLFTSITRSRGASVIHCTAGKDRTGWAIAVLQHLAGIAHEDILADYLATNEQMRIAYGPMLARFAAAGGDAPALSQMIYVEADYLEAAVTLIHDVYGSFDQYLCRALQMSDSEVASLRRHLVGDA